MRLLPWLLLLMACKPETDDKVDEEGDPLGMILEDDGNVYAGAAVIDTTPEIVDTFTDLDGDNLFDGCVDDPTCGEPFQDVNGNGVFDVVWIGGFGPLRAALGVHDPISVRAVVIAQDGEYIAMVSSDYVGLHSSRIHPARDALAAKGFDPDRLVVTSSHNHQGPDTLGLWGNPFFGVPGYDEDYQELVTQAIVDAVTEAAGKMERVDLKVAAVKMRDRSPWLNGADWGGKNPDHKVHGMVYDGRDPVVVSDQLLTFQGIGDEGVVFTATNWSGHPEAKSSENNLISADWIGYTRQALEAEFGGVALHFPESLGGMQSALHGAIPLVADDGTHVFQTCSADDVANDADVDCFGLTAGVTRVDADGDAVPVWSEKYSWDYVRSHGFLIAEAAVEALASAESYEAAPIKLDHEPLYFPIEGEIYNVLAPSGIFDIPLENAIQDTDLCPEAKDVALGCLEASTWRIQLGPIGFTGVPGELLPELAWGFPTEDPRWADEAADPDARGPGAVFFPQHDPDCQATVEGYVDCVFEEAVGDCDCTSIHTWPYRLSDDEALAVPMLDRWDTPFRAVLGDTDTYLSYIIPQPDYNSAVSVFGNDGDHYEDTVSPASQFGDRVLKAQAAMAERW